jgi:hypothetical protein
MVVTLDSTLLFNMASLTDSVGRIFLLAEEACMQQYNTCIFKWTPGPDNSPLPEHYIYCDNNKGIINRLSCSITLYNDMWREIEYNPQQKKFEVKGNLAFLHDYNAEPPASPGVPIPPLDDDNNTYTLYADVTSDI